MEILVLPKGCSIDGKLNTINNSGDIIIECSVPFETVTSKSGGIKIADSQGKIKAGEILAPEGAMDLHFDVLIAAEIEATTAEIKANRLEVQQELRVKETLQIDSESSVLTALKVGDLTITGEHFQCQVLHASGEVIITAPQIRIEELRAKRVIINGSLECNHLIAEEFVQVDSGKIAVKKLESPVFTANPDVTGIVMIATSEEVKAQGVRGFLRPSELDLFSSSAPAAVAAPQAPENEAPTPEIIDDELAPPEEEPWRVKTIEVEGPSGELEQEGGDESEPEEDDSISGLDPISTIPSTSDDNSGPIALAEAEAEAAAQEAPDAQSPWQQIESNIELNHVEENDFETIAAPQMASPENETAAEPLLSAENTDDPEVLQDPDEIQTEVIDLPSDDSFLDIEAQAPEVIDLGGVHHLEDPEEDAAPMAGVSGEIASDFSAPLAEAAAEEAPEVAGSTFDPLGYDEDDSPPADEDVYYTRKMESGPLDEALPEVPSFDDFHTQENIQLPSDLVQANTPAADDSDSDLLSDSHGEVEELSEDDLYSVDDSTSLDGMIPDHFEDGFAAEPEPEAQPETLDQALTRVLDQIRAYFPDENYPKFINQIQHYIEEGRINILVKARNKEAVLSSFDKLDHGEISDLARSFYQVLDTHPDRPQV